jgi:hypothetical protein
MFLFLLSTVVSCKKTADDIVDNDKPKEEITFYLKQKSEKLNGQVSRNTVDYYADLLANLNFAATYTLQNPKANETIYVVPLINDNNPQKATVAVFYKYINIDELDLVAVDNGKEASLDFKNALTFDGNNFTGIMETKNVKGTVTEVAEFANGKVINRKSMEARMAQPVDPNDPPCTDYYYIQYTINALGQEVVVSSTYLYTDCGGGSAPVSEDDLDAIATVNWIPSQGNLTTQITYDVVASEKFKGRKVKFKKAEVLGIGLNTYYNSSGYQFIHTVQNQSVIAGGAGSNFATINAKGIITTANSATPIVSYDKDKNWYSNDIF